MHKKQANDLQCGNCVFCSDCLHWDFGKQADHRSISLTSVSQRSIQNHVHNQAVVMYRRSGPLFKVSRPDWFARSHASRRKQSTLLPSTWNLRQSHPASHQSLHPFPRVHFNLSRKPPHPTLLLPLLIATTTTITFTFTLPHELRILTSPIRLRIPRRMLSLRLPHEIIAAPARQFTIALVFAGVVAFESFAKR